VSNDLSFLDVLWGVHESGDGCEILQYMIAVAIETVTPEILEGIRCLDICGIAKIENSRLVL
jgi:hypothetical protein